MRATARGLFDNPLAVVAFIRNHMLRHDPFHQVASLRGICRGTLCNNDSEGEDKVPGVFSGVSRATHKIAKRLCKFYLVRLS